MPEFGLKIRSRDIQTLIDQIRTYSPDADIETVMRAYHFAEEAHRDQKRLSGEPYIIHPLEVGIILAQLHMDTMTICAALLHDVVEDTGTTLDRIKKEFSVELAQLVDGVTKISHIKNRSRATAQAETLRKMLIATINDMRVIIIKLADKVHNMRTIMFQPQEKQLRIARETLDIYAPIARRLGMSQISSELEDLSFHIVYREEYDEIKNQLRDREHEREAYLENIKIILQEKLGEMDLKPEISGRAKHYFSIFRKMKMQDKSFEDIYDIRAIRVITNELRDCYAILGVIHTLWSPIAGRFKDYIAVPKSNMYQSLHTTVIGPEGHPMEVQIRTREMHETAQMGIAAHWLYKEKRKGSPRDYKDLTLLNNINKLYTETGNSREFMKDLKMDLYEDEIFVFTPKGKIIKLSSDSTPVDFAFAIHSEIGLHTTGAKVNSKLVPLRTKLKSGDIVEVLTSKNGHPSEAWLKFAKSTGARYKIRSWLRKQTPKTTEDTAEKPEPKKDRKVHRTVEVKIPEDEHIKLRKVTRKQKDGIFIEGASNVLIKISQCCQPIPGDNVVGFITRGRGITIHKKTCPSLKRLESEKERFIKVVWEGSENTMYPVKIAVEAMDRTNLLKDVADEISLCKTNIIRAEATVKEKGHAVFKFILEVKGNEHLKEIMQRLNKIRNVTDVYKLNEKVVIK
ncbi:MAG: bifunctional (p)ppGpp synthetase/guanosine-3',5'-bis(diphosphate) 3'-pyrophosphohydrolase [Spirochaetae bacterium HGW-Spirochaetae-1]|jgi:GTP pyrophosphokinase|nr:MAG: bifunctional (p)ppGpp synthetase/guanosine-3',5'-bis(diphosphate) 3'-pyrophosphohydrolase [Spirochaetae bacterium HGW-Spirochaetae-1]